MHAVQASRVGSAGACLCSEGVRKSDESHGTVAACISREGLPSKETNERDLSCPSEDDLLWVVPRGGGVPSVNEVGLRCSCAIVSGLEACSVRELGAHNVGNDSRHEPMGAGARERVLRQCMRQASDQPAHDGPRRAADE